MKIKVKNIDPSVFLSRVFFLAYNACQRSQGMGIFQEMRLGGQQATEEMVWKNVQTAGDYASKIGQSDSEVYGDYVFGRMMKFCVVVSGDTIEVRTETFRPDYQSFCRTYKTPSDLLNAAAKELNCTFDVLELKAA